MMVILHHFSVHPIQMIYMIGKNMKFRLLILSLVLSSSAFSGVDISSTIERVKINGDGKLWLKMTNSTFDEYCKPGWYGFNLFIPEADKSYPYYYGLVASAFSKGQALYIANISVFDGTGSCDLTKTGYGIVVKKSP